MNRTANSYRNNHQANNSGYYFLNPYNFVPTPSRKDTKNLPGFSGDHPPVSHGRAMEGTISGWIDVKLTTITPLLLTDFRRDSRKTRTVRTTGDNKVPELLATSFKGAIRSAYEAITNSRFGTFDRKNQNGSDRSPRSLIESSHLPPTCLEEFSAADRVFGWVGQEASADNQVSAYRGQLSFGTPHCESGSDSIASFREPLPLSILSGAQPGQWRFYTDKGDKPGSKPRGRKFFIPHCLAMSTPLYWPEKEPIDLSVNDSKENLGTGKKSCYREYISPQNPKEHETYYTWIDSWVKPNTEFTVRVYLENVEWEDAVLLVHLLNLTLSRKPKDGLRPQIQLGAGKPLGFGSTTMTIKDSCLIKSESWKERYSSLTTAAQGVGTKERSLKHNDLTQDLVQLLGQIKTNLFSTYTDFIMLSIGWKDFPVHYPRESVEPVKAGFRWFEENKKAQNPQFLPMLDKDKAPILRTHSSKR